MRKSDKKRVDAYRKKKKKSNIIEGSLIPVPQEIDMLSDLEILALLIKEKRIQLANSQNEQSRFRRIQGGK